MLESEEAGRGCEAGAFHPRGDAALDGAVVHGGEHQGAVDETDFGDEAGNDDFVPEDGAVAVKIGPVTGGFVVVEVFEEFEQTIVDGVRFVDLEQGREVFAGDDFEARAFKAGEVGGSGANGAGAGECADLVIAGGGDGA